MRVSCCQWGPQFPAASRDPTAAAYVATTRSTVAVNDDECHLPGRASRYFARHDDISGHGGLMPRPRSSSTRPYAIISHLFVAAADADDDAAHQTSRHYSPAPYLYLAAASITAQHQQQVFMTMSGMMILCNPIPHCCRRLLAYVEHQ